MSQRIDTAPARSADEVQALAAQLDTERGRLALLHGDALHVLTETPSEAELAKQRELAEWRRTELREAERAELSDQLAAAAAVRKAAKEIRDADIRDAVDARKALAAQRRAETPESTVAELHRYSRWTRYGCAGIIAAGMVWSAINVQQNMAPGGTADPLFWASYLIEGMISGLLIIIALGTAKVREAAPTLEPSRGTRVAEVGLFALTLGLNTYPYLRAAHWYDAALHAVAPGMIGAALLVLHALGADYAQARRIVSERITGTVQLPELPALQTVHPAPSYPVEQPDTVHRAAPDTVHPVDTVHRAGGTVQSTVHRAARDGDDTEQFPCTVHPDTVHRAASATVEPVAHHHDGDTVQASVHTEQHTVHPADRAPREADAEALDYQERDTTVATVHGGAEDTVQAVETEQPPLDSTVHRAADIADTVQSAPAEKERPEAGPSTPAVDTEQFARTVQASVHPDTVHRAVRAETVQSTVHTVQHTVHPDTVHRAAVPATSEQAAEDPTDLVVLAAEVHSRLSRTKFSVEDVAKVLTAHRRHGYGADRIYRDKIGPHRDITSKWLKLAQEIEHERAADMAPVVRLREHG
ncbi:hypothetical protein IU501_35375 [Nocardia otitidiscaviarum]|uniref:hypothetical protein n=1 Tax=Nocardia otitidiscaviarum TaxID=1823 RepID=UPI0018949D6E|nr:hypothetical protein [Nocardia otitidiscaviarum]MBF6138256.1 hypothetical protein [Nocardia otitidiscaviarum]